MLLNYYILGYLDYHTVVTHVSDVCFVDVLVYPFVLYVAVLSSKQPVLLVVET
jgi:hypothetical protein